MKSITLHVTDLDSMLWYRKLEDMDSDAMVSRLKRTSSPNDKMLYGTAWHSIIERPPDEIETIERNGITFRVECDAEIILPQIREIRATKAYDVDGVRVILTGGCDGATGNKISDHKLTFNPEPETYLTSYQWRAYLDIYNADSFEYIIYHAKEGKGDKEVIIKDVSTITMFRYPGMVDDLISGIHDLLGFIKAKCPEMINQ